MIAKTRRPAEDEDVARFERNDSTGSRRRTPPKRNRAVSPSDTETTGTPGGNRASLSSLSWCSPMRPSRS